MRDRGRGLLLQVVEETLLSAYRTESCVINHPEELRQAWLELQDRADCSYFLSWGWIGTWLQQIAIALRPFVIRVWYGEQLVGLAVFVQKDIKRRIAFRASALFLHEYPFNHNNMVIEYNGLLAARGHEPAVYAETVGHLFEQYRHYDEFHFGAIAEGPELDSLVHAGVDHAGFIINEESTAWQVDLDALDPGIDALLAILSKNRRTQLRRSLRHFEERGPLGLIEAQDLEQALVFFDGLKVLHTERRQLKGEGGAFANPVWEQFHRALIRERFSAGDIQMIKVSNPLLTIGYLYNFIWRKHVYVLQTGFTTGADKRELPGYVVHALAIVHNRNKGMAIYDLMHGDDLYKRILCNRKRRLFWGVYRRRRLKFSLERAVVGMVRCGRRLMG
jgi:CelD/BcsL family acetyltransferase involved in cellulose biosynthesis